MTRVAGIDPGILNIGLSIVDVLAAGRYIYALPNLKLSSTMKVDHRMALIARTLDGIAATGVDVFCVEDQTGAYFGAQERGETNARAARNMGVVDLARGIAQSHGIGFLLVTPAQLRKDLGLQRDAEKADIERAVRARVTGIPDEVTSHDIDAIGFAIIGARRWEFEETIRRTRERTAIESGRAQAPHRGANDAAKSEGLDGLQPARPSEPNTRRPTKTSKASSDVR